MSLIKESNLESEITMRGAMPIDEIFKALYNKDSLIQSSKTAINGDME